MVVEEYLERSFGTIPELVRMHAARAPQHPALIQDERTVDFGALDSWMDRIAAALQRDRPEAKGSIAICSANSIEYAAVFLGALRAGLAVAPLAPSSTPEAIASMVADAGASHLFLDEAPAKAIAPVLPRIAARTIALASLPQWIADATSPRAIQAAPDDAFNII